MSQALTVARPYAQALFHFSEKNDQCILWLNASLVLATLSRTKKFSLMVRDPSVDDATLLAFMQELVVECVPDIKANEPALQQYLGLLIERDRLLIMHDIHELFMRLLAEKDGTRNVQVTSAYGLSEQQQQRMQQALEKRFSCRVQLSYKEDADLIGGATVRSGSWVMDGSVQDKLANLRSLFED